MPLGSTSSSDSFLRNLPPQFANREQIWEEFFSKAAAMDEEDAEEIKFEEIVSKWGHVQSSEPQGKDTESRSCSESSEVEPRDGDLATPDDVEEKMGVADVKVAQEENAESSRRHFGVGLYGPRNKMDYAQYWINTSNFDAEITSDATDHSDDCLSSCSSFDNISEHVNYSQMSETIEPQLKNNVSMDYSSRLYDDWVSTLKACEDSINTLHNPEYSKLKDSPLSDEVCSNNIPGCDAGNTVLSSNLVLVDAAVPLDTNQSLELVKSHQNVSPSTDDVQKPNNHLEESFGSVQSHASIHNHKPVQFGDLENLSDIDPAVISSALGKNRPFSRKGRTFTSTLPVVNEDQVQNCQMNLLKLSNGIKGSISNVSMMESHVSASVSETSNLMFPGLCRPLASLNNSVHSQTNSVYSSQAETKLDINVSLQTPRITDKNVSSEHLKTPERGDLFDSTEKEPVKISDSNNVLQESKNPASLSKQNTINLKNSTVLGRANVTMFEIDSDEEPSMYSFKNQGRSDNNKFGTKSPTPKVRSAFQRSWYKCATSLKPNPKNKNISSASQCETSYKVENNLQDESKKQPVNSTPQILDSLNRISHPSTSFGHTEFINVIPKLQLQNRINVLNFNSSDNLLICMKSRQNSAGKLLSVDLPVDVTSSNVRIHTNLKPNTNNPIVLLRSTDQVNTFIQCSTASQEPIQIGNKEFHENSKPGGFYDENIISNEDSSLIFNSKTFFDTLPVDDEDVNSCPGEKQIPSEETKYPVCGNVTASRTDVSESDTTVQMGPETCISVNLQESEPLVIHDLKIAPQLQSEKNIFDDILNKHSIKPNRDVRVESMKVSDAHSVPQENKDWISASKVSTLNHSRHVNTSYLKRTSMLLFEMASDSEEELYVSSYKGQTFSQKCKSYKNSSQDKKKTTSDSKSSSYKKGSRFKSHQKKRSRKSTTVTLDESDDLELKLEHESSKRNDASSSSMSDQKVSLKYVEYVNGNRSRKHGKPTIFSSSNSNITYDGLTKSSSTEIKSPVAARHSMSPRAFLQQSKKPLRLSPQYLLANKRNTHYREKSESDEDILPAEAKVRGRGKLAAKYSKKPTKYDSEEDEMEPVSFSRSKRQEPKLSLLTTPDLIKQSRRLKAAPPLSTKSSSRVQKTKQNVSNYSRSFSVSMLKNTTNRQLLFEMESDSDEDIIWRSKGVVETKRTTQATKYEQHEYKKVGQQNSNGQRLSFSSIVQPSQDEILHNLIPLKKLLHNRKRKYDK